MRTLPTYFQRKGFRYTQILRGPKACLYSQGVSKEMENFEVFLLRVKPERCLHGKILEAGEIYPHDAAFGFWAWTYKDYKRALKKYYELEKINDHEKSYETNESPIREDGV